MEFSLLTEYLIQEDLLYCSLCMDDFDQAKVYIDKNLSLVSEASFNWFKMMNYNFIHASLTNNFNDSSLLLQKF